MANLIVRNVDEKIIKALKARAGRRGVSAEAEHREILAQALLKSRKRSFAEVIAAMPMSAKIQISNASRTTRTSSVKRASVVKLIVGETLFR